MSSHRERVMQLLAESAGDQARSLCVLGAGNANDLELDTLATRFERIALVDLDEDALQRAWRRIPPNLQPRCDLHGQVDLTGITAMLGEWHASTPPSDRKLESAIASTRQAAPPRVGPFDVVASTCVLTQLIDSICLAIPHESPRRLEMILAVRNRHLEHMVELLHPGGTGVLVTDFVASETAPELARLSDAEVADRATHWLGTRNFFTGTNPYAIVNHLSASGNWNRFPPPALSGVEPTTHRDIAANPLQSRELCIQFPADSLETTSVKLIPAWKWDLGAKQLAVTAVTFRRAVGSPLAH